MRFLRRMVERFLIACLSAVFIWLSVTQVFERLDQRMPVFVAGICTYILVAYLALPRLIRFGLMIFRRGRIPHFTQAADGLMGDPVNIALVGSEDQLRAAFKKIGWFEADEITLASSWRMVQALLQNKPYYTAPFSYLYLFGRRQDYGFQKSITTSPRQRHHVRFWAANIDPNVSFSDVAYWLKKHPVDHSKPVMWVGAATKDIGIGLSALTYQFTHRVDKNIDDEREYILKLLRGAGCVAGEEYAEPGKFLQNKYRSDGKIVVATLAS